MFKTDLARYFDPIELNQYINKGYPGLSGGKVQPSLHVGVRSVPQLTTSNANLIPDKFTDVECTWDM